MQREIEVLKFGNRYAPAFKNKKFSLAHSNVSFPVSCNIRIQMPRANYLYVPASFFFLARMISVSQHTQQYKGLRSACESGGASQR